MHPIEYFLLSVALAGLVVALVRANCKSPKEEEQRPPEISRWKTFHVRSGSLHKQPSSPLEALVEEEPKGLKLLLSEWERSERRVIIRDEEGNTRVRISRGMLFTRKRLQVDLDGRSLLRILPAPKGKKIPVLRFAEGAEKRDVQGDPASREYEIRKDAKLVAIVSRPGATARSSPAGEYIVETLKTEEPLPLLAIALALDVALGPAPESAPRKTEAEAEAEAEEQE
jgi:uncharacterized protein YxjI